MDLSLLLALLVMMAATAVRLRFALPLIPSGVRPADVKDAVPPRAWEIFSDQDGQAIVNALINRVPDTPRPMEVDFFVGPHGHVREPKLVRSSGAPAIDGLVIHKLLPALPLPKPPPPGARMPFTLQVSIFKGGWLYSLEQAGEHAGR